MPYLDPAYGDKVIRAATQANLRRQQIERLRRAPVVAQPGEPRSLSLDQLDQFARRRAREPSSRTGDSYWLQRVAGRVLVLALTVAVVAVLVRI